MPYAGNENVPEMLSRQLKRLAGHYASRAIRICRSVLWIVAMSTRTSTLELVAFPEPESADPRQGNIARQEVARSGTRRVRIPSYRTEGHAPNSPTKRQRQARQLGDTPTAHTLARAERPTDANKNERKTRREEEVTPRESKERR